jgi:transcriptional regulator with XRE-family HTH domain
MTPRPQLRDPKTHAGALLGENLRLARTLAGYKSQEDLAAALGTDRSVVTKAETGERPPHPDVLTAWLDACGVSGPLRKAIEGMWHLARAREEPGRARTAPWFEAESKAHTLRYWAPVIVPGICQTRPYASALITAMGYDEAKVNEYLEDRMRRQVILGRPTPADVSIVVWEPVLRHLIGSPEVMHEQVARLMELSYRPTIMIQVLPARGGANAGLGGAINLAATHDAPELLLSDGIVEDVVTADVAPVMRASSTFNSVRADALNRAESREAITEAMETWK